MSSLPYTRQSGISGGAHPAAARSARGRRRVAALAAAVRPGARRRGPLVPGALFAGRYRMVASLGRGVVGEVWHADDLVVGTPVALKVIDLTIAESRGQDSRRGQARAPDHPPGRLPRVRRRRDRTSSVLFDGAGGRRGRGDAAAARGPSAGGEGGRHRPAAVRRPRGRARAGRAAPRAQAGQHSHRRQGARSNHRLRHRRAGCRRRARGVGQRQRVPGARATDRRARRCRRERTCSRSASSSTSCWLAGRRLPAVLDRRAPVRPSALVPDVDPGLERAIMAALSVDPARRPASAAAHGGAADGRRRAAPDRSSPLAVDRRRRDRRGGRRPGCASRRCCRGRRRGR